MRTITLFVVAIVAVIALAASGFPADRYRHNDFDGFYLGGLAVLEGRDPYDVPTWIALHQRIGSEMRAVVPRATAFGYPLTTALLATPFALFPVAIAAPLWLVAQLALALAAVTAVGERLFGASARRDLPLLVAFVAASQPLWVLVEGGNVNGFVLAIVAGAAALLLARRPLAAGLLLGLLVVKPHPYLLFGPALLLVAPGRARIAAGAAATSGALVLASFAIHPTWVAEWLGSVSRIAAAPAGRATLWGLSGPDAPWLGALLAIAAMGAAALWWRARRPDLATGIALLLPLSLLVAPYGWSYDQLVLAVTVAVAIRYAAALDPAHHARALALIALCAVPLPWMLYVTAFSRGEESWSVATPIALALTVVLLEATARDPRLAVARARSAG